MCVLGVKEKQRYEEMARQSSRPGPNLVHLYFETMEQRLTRWYNCRLLIVRHLSTYLIATVLDGVERGG